MLLQVLLFFVHLLAFTVFLSFSVNAKPSSQVVHFANELRVAVVALHREGSLVTSTVVAIQAVNVRTASSHWTGPRRKASSLPFSVSERVTSEAKLRLFLWAFLPDPDCAICVL